MSTINLEKIFLIIALLFASSLVLFTFLPFVGALVLAIALALVFRPLHRQIKKLIRWETPAALISTLIIILLVIAPLLFFAYKILQETQELYLSLAYYGGDDSVKTIIGQWQKFQQWFGLSNFPVINEIDLIDLSQQALSWLLNHLGGIFSSIIKLLIGVFITFLSLFYFLRDSHHLRRFVLKASPLSTINNNTIIERLEQTIVGILQGFIMVALIQGFSAWLGFMIFGLPKPFLWGTLTAVAALIPGVGTAMVTIPATIYLFFSGKLLAAAGLAVWSLTMVGIVDNFLNPYLVGKKINLHPLLVLIAVLGGINLFGAFGFILGPMGLALFLTLVNLKSENILAPTTITKKRKTARKKSDG